MKSAAAAALVAAAAVAAAVWFMTQDEPPPPLNAETVPQGRALYGEHCASCHGADLEGEPNWRTRGPDGLLPAPPHDETGHTWHHPDEQLFLMTKEGVEALAPPGYKSNMPGFGDVLTDDEIWAVLEYIKSAWPENERAHQARVSSR
ncbi:MAG: c-type cytochrome [Rhodospirillales bacterium]